MMTWTRPRGGWWEWRLTGSSWFPSLLPVWLSSRGFLSSLSCCPQLRHVALCADLWGAFTELWLCPAVLLACYVTVTFNVFSKSEKLLHHRMQSFCLVCFVFALAAVSGVSLCICFLVFTRHPFAAVSKPLPLSHCRCFPYLPAFAFVAFCCLVVCPGDKVGALDFTQLMSRTKMQQNCFGRSHRSMNPDPSFNTINAATPRDAVSYMWSFTRCCLVVL